MNDNTSQEHSGGLALLRLLVGRDGEHAAEANSAFADHAPNISLALRFMRAFLDGREIAPHLLFPNEAAALLLFGRVYHQLRAATFLALHGYYTEVWGTLRAAYECGSLARYLSKNSQRAEEWFQRGEWIREREVHRSTPPLKDSSQQLYRHLSEMTHPTLRASAALLDTRKAGFALNLDQPYDERVFTNCLANIDGVALWSCLALRNCLPNRGFVPPREQEILEALAERVAPDTDWSHLRVDWAEALADNEKRVAAVQPAAKLDEALRKYGGALAGADQVHDQPPSRP